MQTIIKGYTFNISEPFQAGTIITKGEAQALNNLRTENIANNLRKLVNDQLALLQPGEMIPSPVLEEIQSQITRYDHGYTFVEKHTPKLRLGDIEAEAREIARERVEAQLRRIGSTLEPEKMEEAISANALFPTVLEEARERVAVKRRVASEGLDTL